MQKNPVVSSPARILLIRHPPGMKRLLLRRMRDVKDVGMGYALALGQGIRKMFIKEGTPVGVPLGWN
jgi:hypothetical protein